MGKIETEMGVNDHWGTPRTVWEPLVKCFGTPGLDPFWNPYSEVPAKVRWTNWNRCARGGWLCPAGAIHTDVVEGSDDSGVEAGVDSFSRCWDGYGLVYVNGPFSAAALYLGRCAEEGDEVVFLFKANMNARYVHKFVRPADRLAFFEKRLTYVGAKYSATFHTGLGYWGTRPELFREAYADRAWVVKGDCAV